MWQVIFTIGFQSLTVAASDLGPTALASHNIMMCVFFFSGCFADNGTNRTVVFTGSRKPGQDSKNNV
jgi:hypothetical protein